jgi:5-(carboxyamino)imidazole ribonucleotide mutase
MRDPSRVGRVREPVDSDCTDDRRTLARDRARVCGNRVMTAAPSSTAQNPVVAVIMGSKSDWPTMKLAADVLAELAITFEARVISAHRTPDLMFEYAESAAARGIQVIIAGAGGAAHLPGMTASKTTLPVLGVPIQSKALQGVDSLLSIVQMPKGVPVATLSIGEAGAVNAALLAAAILALRDQRLSERLEQYRAKNKKAVLEEVL